MNPELSEEERLLADVSRWPKAAAAEIATLRAQRAERDAEIIKREAVRVEQVALIVERDAAIAEARVALEPFAREAETWGKWPDDLAWKGPDEPSGCPWDTEPGSFTLGDLRTARAALARLDALGREPS